MPMKRNKNLVVLSREHHTGLVFCSRLKKSKNVDDAVLESFVNDFWTNDLALHFKKEESLLLPQFKDESIARQFLSEHSQIKSLIHSIVEHGSNHVQDDCLKLSQLIHDHIRFEERTMFPYLEQTISLADLEFIGLELEKTESAACQFLPRFWEDN